ncbi:MAG: 3-phosphoshikimate 1-carboxyvinyltransferase [Candidatus Muiribacteriaceae bacterium]
MNTYRYSHRKQKSADILIPPDKSISHRTVLLNSLPDTGKARVRNFLFSEDTLASIQFARKSGLHVIENRHCGELLLKREKRKQDLGEVDCGNSGTTVRLALAIAASLGYRAVFTGDSSLSSRPMDRITEFLRQMGADIEGHNTLPLTVRRSEISKIDFETELGSAQQKSAFILASLFAKGEEAVFHYTKESRDHTELMLDAMGAILHKKEHNGRKSIIIPSQKDIKMMDFKVPGDFSSAAFFIILGLYTPGLVMRLRDVSLNPTRARLLEILTEAGGDIRVENKKMFGGEQIGDIIVRESSLDGVKIDDEKDIPFLIDEIPVLSVAMAYASGKSEFLNIGELRFKESDRLKKICNILDNTEADYECDGDSLRIYPGRGRSGDVPVVTGNDHRIVMSAVINSCISGKSVIMDEITSVNISFPDFFEKLKEAGYHAG